MVPPGVVAPVSVVPAIIHISYSDVSVPPENVPLIATFDAGMVNVQMVPAVSVAWTSTSLPFASFTLSIAAIV
jgi:hypothetical protein